MRSCPQTLHLFGEAGHAQTMECSGTCGTWVHRKCAGLSKVVYNEISKSEKPFYCPQCRFDQQELEIRLLRELVGALGNELDALKKKFKDQITSSLPPNSTYAEVIGQSCASNLPFPGGAPISGNNVNSCAQVNAPRDSMSNARVDLNNMDRKFNVILFGVEECSEGTARPTRQIKDLEKIADAFSCVNCTISASSIKDHFRLGKYNRESTKPRPILVKFIRSADVFSVLPQTGSLEKLLC